MYKIFPIPVPAPASAITAYKSLRLTSLQLDPASFGSNYAREVAFTDDVWHKRLNSPFKRTFVASIASASSPDGTSASGAGGPDTDGHEKWIGTVTILGPSELLPSTLAPFDEARVGANWAMYFLAAMWVHHDHRGKGVGYRLVKEGMEWARKNVDPKFANDEVEKEKVVLLLVGDHNSGGRALYSRAGFRDLVEMPAQEGERWMVVKV
ncbi:hypothetical protein HYDPIDRAFT_111973 [Hydnomerulius pinastri MD-312]|uniref:N-acetyltransferase domain-containing protein n=1 Tax=Hydnomerulius pinastri MD-312 TaxID=994086 RepID=A0A0C9W180_9AGAM|nr:hypothetical protein HYDPIDRAFT_111973 [Hydnomerulius pinastri MD-312]